LSYNTVTSVFKLGLLMIVPHDLSVHYYALCDI